MNKLKLLLLTLSSSTILFGQCTYNLDVKFDFQNKNINVQTNIKDTQKSLILDINKFEIVNKISVEKALKNGINKISFEYNKKIDKLNEDFIYLLNSWYPTLESNCSYNIKTNLTDNYKKVYEKTDKEINNFNFIASKNFVIRIKKYKNITLKTYFLRDDDNLVKKYFDKTIEYIKLYEKRIGKFPYNEFKIVENIYQTGYSMPTFTLIGSRLLAKDYILNQSLGHEILHQYFGNSIFNDFDKGNWVEGLTTFLADDYYKKLSKTDIENRKLVLNQYNTYVNTSNDFPINDFTHRYNKVSSLIGYSKLAFVFHMLEKKIGEKSFSALVKRFYEEYKFKEANLKDIALFFDKNTKIDLKEFFTQWLYKKGQIDFKIENIKNSFDKDGFALHFDLLQNKDNFYKFDLPINITTYDGKVSKVIKVDSAKQSIKIKLDSEVLNFTLDKNYDLFRKLSKDENFYTIANLLSAKSLIAIVNKEDKKEYEILKRSFPNIKYITSDDVKFKEIKENSVIFLDSKNKLLKQFYPDINIKQKDTYITVKPHIYNDKKVIALINIGEYKKRYLMMLKHYSKYSQVVLSKDATEKTLSKTPNGMSFKLAKIPNISKIQKKQKIDKIYEKIKDKRVVYVGESHTNFEHHLNQLRVIKSLHKNGKDIAIAMEMFQKPFQKDLDEYLEGKTTLDEFLKNSEYYKRWVYDYSLYKPIIDYAKKNKIPIVALNIDRKINKQVSKKGLLSLDKKQKEIAPKEIDQSNLVYKKNLEDTFKAHIPLKAKTTMNMDNFYQSQLIWDETMAENIDEYLKENPKKTMVVIVGAGHIEKHHGIPSRVYRRNNLPYQVVINNPHKANVDDIAILNKTNAILPKEKKVGVALKNNNDLTVIKVVEDSFASKIHINKNDKIIKLNGEKVNSIADIKRILYLIDDINKLEVTINRDGNVLKLKTNM